MQLAAMLQPLRQDHRLWPLFFHFAPVGDSDEHAAMLREVRLPLVSMCAQLWWMFLWPHRRAWTVQLAKMCDDRTDDPEKAILAREFWTAPACCKNTSFEGKVAAATKAAAIAAAAAATVAELLKHNT